MSLVKRPESSRITFIFMPVSQVASNKGVFRGNLDGDLLGKLKKKVKGN